MEVVRPAITTHAENIAPYRKWFELAAKSANFVYLALALTCLYVAIFVGDTSSPLKRLVGGLILIAVPAVLWYFVCVRRSGKSCIVGAVFFAAVGLKTFGDGSLWDYVFAGLTSTTC